MRRVSERYGPGRERDTAWTLLSLARTMRIAAAFAGGKGMFCPYQRRLGAVASTALTLALMHGCTFTESVGNWVADPAATGPAVPVTTGGDRPDTGVTPAGPRGAVTDAESAPAEPTPEESATPIDVENEPDPDDVATKPRDDEQAVALEPQDTRPRFEAPDGTMLPVLGSTELENGLVVQGLRAGSNEASECAADSTVIVHYHGTLEDGTVIDTTRGRDPAGPWPLAQVMPGWRQGMAGMRVGGIRRLIIPADLAYGDTAVTDPDTGEVLIPAGSPLVYTIELIGIR